MKVVIAPDSFKGSLSSTEVARAAAKAVADCFPSCSTVTVGAADGGEGTVRAMTAALGGDLIKVMVSDPLGRQVEAEYGKAGDTAVIETAAACGLVLLSPEERNPMDTSTFGVGEMILDALGRGCGRFIIGLGGSATNDGGTGMLSALGVRFLDSEGREIRGCGGSLGKIVDMDCSGIPESLSRCSFTVACDVDTPFCGPSGAAEVFAPQKGAGPEQVKILDMGMAGFAGLVKDKLGRDIAAIPGSGAAGGLGGAFSAFLGARLRSGVDMVLDAIGFDSLLEGADLVITGEGRADGQTPKGKTAAGILRRAGRAGIPTVLIAGEVENSEALESLGFRDIIRVTPEGMPLEVAMDPEVAAGNIYRALVDYFGRR